MSQLDQSNITIDEYRHNYTVEIPDNNGWNYIEESAPLTEKQCAKILTPLRKEFGKKYVDEWYPYLLPKYNNEREKGVFFYSDLKTDFQKQHKGSAPQLASQFLSKCGFVGIHYDGHIDGSCYVIFDENDAKIISHNLFGLDETNK